MLRTHDAGTPDRRCRSIRPALLALIALLVMFVMAPVAVAQEGGASESPPPTALDEAPLPTIEELQKRKSELPSRVERGEIDEATSRALLTALDQTIEALRRAKEAEDGAAQFERERLAAEQEQREVEEELKNPPTIPVKPPPTATLEELKQSRDAADASLRQAQEQLQNLEAESKRREVRRDAIPKEKAAAQLELEKVTTELAAAPPPDQPAELTDALRTSLRAKQRMYHAQVGALDKELANYAARSDLLPKRVTRWENRRAARGQAAKQWRDMVTEREQRNIREEQAAARKAKAEANPAVKEIAEKNLELTDERADITKDKSDADERRATAEAELERIIDRHQLALERARYSGYSDFRLRAERAGLPDDDALKRRIREVSANISSAQLKLSDLQFDEHSLPSPAKEKADAINRIAPDTPAELREQIEREIDRLVDEKRSKYDALIGAYTEYAEVLAELLRFERQLLAVSEEFRDFINERILWIRSTDAVWGEDLSDVSRELRVLLSPENWRDVGLDLSESFLHRPVAHILAMLVVGVLLVRRRAMKRRLVSIAAKVRRALTDRMSHTVVALLLTLGLAAGWALLVWTLGRSLVSYAQAGDFSKAVGAGLARTGLVLFVLEGVRQLCRTGGLADAHFRWRAKTRSVLRGNLLWFTPAILPISFIINFGEHRTSGAGNDPLGRIAFMIGVLLFAVLLARLLRPTGGVFEGVLNAHRGGWLDRLKYIWYPVAVAVPLVNVVVAALGYYYTAMAVQRSTSATMWLTLILIIINGLVLRWLMQARRRIAIEEARKRRAAMQAEAAARGEATPTGEAPLQLDEPKLGLNEVDAQARHMLHSAIAFAVVIGFWAIWSQMLPALGVLERVEIWPQFRIASDAPAALDTVDQVGALSSPSSGALESAGATNGNGIADPPPADGAAAGSDAASAQPATPGSQLLPTAVMTGAPPETTDSAPSSEKGVVTLMNLLVAILILVITLVVSRNLPGLLEITVLQRLPLEPSGRYAITTIARYTLLIVGIAITFGAIGIGWSKVQWLAAAITVGLAFGLQEIFANFVSGIIILFERPVRVGDTVTVGDVSGTVSRIRMRATTITDWDRKELVIPNKEFVTGQIINWSLSDPILRVTVSVGIAYGSDTELARQILLKVAAEHPNVLADPPPRALFLGFGESSLDFDIRAYIPSIEYFLSVKHDLHMMIDKAFREANIEIAFPQRDIHVRSVGAEFPVDVREGGEAVVRSSQVDAP
jgi:potassium efflux system protein